MKSERLLFLLMVICLANGVKAQFYDGADDIYYYVQENDKNFKNTKDLWQDVGEHVYVFNFDGRKACCWGHAHVYQVKEQLKKNPNYFEDATETSDYNMIFSSNTSSETIYTLSDYTFKFSKDRSRLTKLSVHSWSEHAYISYFKRVDKSYFKVGRSRTPNKTLYE